MRCSREREKYYNYATRSVAHALHGSGPPAPPGLPQEQAVMTTTVEAATTMKPAICYTIKYDTELQLLIISHNKFPGSWWLRLRVGNRLIGPQRRWGGGDSWCRELLAYLCEVLHLVCGPEGSWGWAATSAGSMIAVSTTQPPFVERMD